MSLKRPVGQQIALATIAFPGCCAGVLYSMSRPLPPLPQTSVAVDP